jgi:hypothetical protein
MVKLTDLLREILTEISIEQLKTQFVDSGKISQNDFDEIINVTPKTAYITWLAKKVADQIIKAEDIYKYKKYFSIFDRRKKEYPFTDINQYKTPDDLSQFANKSVEISNKESEDPSQQKGISKANKYKEFYIGSVNGFDVYKLPKGRKDLYGTSCELGSGTEWCTATGNTRGHLDNYISHGPLFVFIKPGSNEKYQFHYESQSFMDKNDISIKTETAINALYNLFQFIEDKEPQYRTPLKFKLLNHQKLTPEDLKVKSFLDLSNTPITTLPDGLEIEDGLDISNTNITSLPNNLKAKGLFMSNTPISSFPNNFKIEGDLALNYTEITTLPDNLEVGGELYLQHSPITSIPSSLRVNGGLWLRNTPISKKYTKEQLKQMLPGVKGDIRMS